MGRYEGKTAVITGGTSGMGLATAKLLVHEGARVLVTGRTAKTLESAREELGKNAIVMSSDATSLTDIDALAARVKLEFGAVDFLFLNAGYGKFAPFEGMSEAVYDEMFNLNTKGPYFATQKLAPLMPPGSAIVLTTSIANVKGMPMISAYAAAKAALRLACALARSGASAAGHPRQRRQPRPHRHAGHAQDRDVQGADGPFPYADAGRQSDEALRSSRRDCQGSRLPRVRRHVHDRRRVARGRRPLPTLDGATARSTRLPVIHQDTRTQEPIISNALRGTSR